MKKYKCPDCGIETLSLTQKADLLAGQECRCNDCGVFLKIDGLFRLLVCILAPMSMSMSISFVLILTTFGFLTALPASFVISIVVYFLIAMIVPVAAKAKEGSK